MGEALNHPLLRYRALLRGRGLFAAKVDLVQREDEHVRRDVEFVGTEAINGRLEHFHASALGLRNLAKYLARSLLETGGFRPQQHPRS